MAETAWRCSQCGTVNEPGSHACAGCGKWPSLFDLQDEIEEPEAFEPAPLDPEQFEDGDAWRGTRDAEAIESEPLEFEPFEPESESDDEPRPARGLRTLTRFIVPVALLLYFLVSQLSNR